MHLTAVEVAQATVVAMETHLVAVVHRDRLDFEDHYCWVAEFADFVAVHLVVDLVHQDPLVSFPDYPLNAEAVVRLDEHQGLSALVVHPAVVLALPLAVVAFPQEMVILVGRMISSADKCMDFV